MLDFVTPNKNGVLVISSLALAELAGRNHHSVLQLVRHKRKQVESLGTLELAIEPFETNGGPQKREVAYLTESQVLAMISHMRNFGAAIDLKQQVVKAFADMREQMNRADMGQLVSFDGDGQAVTTSLAIAAGVERPHKNIIELIRQNIESFEGFGPLAF